MNQFRKTNLTRKIVTLNPNKTLWIFGLFLPMFTIWLRYVGLFVIESNGRNSKFFNYLSAILIGAIFVLFVIAFGLSIWGLKIPELSNMTIPLMFLSVWFTCNGIVSKNMVDLENKDNEYFRGITKLREYIFRFFHLFYFPFSIYYLQKEVNKYLE